MTLGEGAVAVIAAELAVPADAVNRAVGVLMSRDVSGESAADWIGMITAEFFDDVKLSEELQVIARYVDGLVDKQRQQERMRNAVRKHGDAARRRLEKLREQWEDDE